jgi:hypothetical protein
LRQYIAAHGARQPPAGGDVEIWLRAYPPNGVIFGFALARAPE